MNFNVNVDAMWFFDNVVLVMGWRGLHFAFNLTHL